MSVNFFRQLDISDDRRLSGSQHLQDLIPAILCIDDSCKAVSLNMHLVIIKVMYNSIVNKTEIMKTRTKSIEADDYFCLKQEITKSYDQEMRRKKKIW